MHNLYRSYIQGKKVFWRVCGGLREVYKVSLGDVRCAKQIDRIFEGCIAFYGRLIEVPNK